MSKIVYFGKRSCIRFLKKARFQAAAESTAHAKGKRIERIAYVFVTDEALLDINKTHLQHDYYTDIITFDLSEDPNVVDAEIYISHERVTENASAFNSDTEAEFLRVMFHGLLHLCGFADKTESQKKQMRLMEAHSVNLYREMGTKKGRST